MVFWCNISSIKDADRNPVLRELVTFKLTNKKMWKRYFQERHQPRLNLGVEWP